MLVNGASFFTKYDFAACLLESQTKIYVLPGRIGESFVESVEFVEQIAIHRNVSGEEELKTNIMRILDPLEMHRINRMMKSLRVVGALLKPIWAEHREQPLTLPSREVRGQPTGTNHHVIPQK